LGLISPGLAQSQSTPNPSTSSEINDLAAALVRAASEEEQERLLAMIPVLMNGSLIAALKALAKPSIKKGDYAQALRISQLAARVAERIGDRVGLGNALIDLRRIHTQQNRSAQALDYLQKGLAIFEETEGKKGKTRALLRIGLTHESQGRFNQALEYYDKSLAISLETRDRNATALIFNNMGNVHYSLGRYELGLRDGARPYERGRKGDRADVGAVCGGRAGDGG
jgi:tetratricopeptide (TPR) repeat protein